MSDSRPTRFELHIRPMFRRKDRDSMLWAFDLWNYEDVKHHAEEILTRLEVDMPPEAHGGTWPPEWIATFKRWIEEDDFGQLELGKGTYSASQSGDVLTLKAAGDYPTDTHVGWLQRRESSLDVTLEFDLFLDSIEEGSEPGFPFDIKEELTVSQTIETVLVHDATGAHTVVVDQE